VRAAWSRTAANPDRAGRDDEEQADNANTIAPATTTPVKRGVVTVSLAQCTPASSHTPS